MIRLALFLPTPGRLRIDLKSVGILPLYSSLKTFIHLLISLALLFPRPQGRTISSISATSAAASASTVGYFLNNAGVVKLTLSSVHCADNITAITI